MGWEGLIGAAFGVIGTACLAWWQYSRVAYKEYISRRAKSAEEAYSLLSRVESRYSSMLECLQGLGNGSMTLPQFIKTQKADIEAFGRYDESLSKLMYKADVEFRGLLPAFREVYAVVGEIGDMIPAADHRYPFSVLHSDSPVLWRRTATLEKEFERAFDLCRKQIELIGSEYSKKSAYTLVVTNQPDYILRNDPSRTKHVR